MGQRLLLSTQVFLAIILGGLTLTLCASFILYVAVQEPWQQAAGLICRSLRWSDKNLISAASTCQRRSVTDQRTLASHSPRSTMTFARCLAINAVQEQANREAQDAAMSERWVRSQVASIKST
eukprot:s11454_g1.t1